VFVIVTGAWLSLRHSYRDQSEKLAGLHPTSARRDINPNRRLLQKDEG
jgi:hypothetical protein